jgi:hypothetical protein
MRSRTSGENFTVVLVVPSTQTVEPLQSPRWFTDILMSQKKWIELE